MQAAFCIYFCDCPAAIMFKEGNISSSSLAGRFEKIYSATYPKLYSFVKYYAWNEDAVKDVLQECYIRLWEHLPSLKDDEKIMPLLRTYAMRITIDAVRRHARDMERAAAYSIQQPHSCTADEGLYEREIMQLYRNAIATLPPQQRTVFLLAREEKLSYVEIAQKLNLSTYTVKRHMSEALRSLRSRIPVDKLPVVLIVIENAYHLVFPGPGR